jgi:hypothetical protein
MCINVVIVLFAFLFNSCWSVMIFVRPSSTTVVASLLLYYYVRWQNVVINNVVHRIRQDRHQEGVVTYYYSTTCSTLLWTVNALSNTPKNFSIVQQQHPKSTINRSSWNISSSLSQGQNFQVLIATK